MPAQSVNTIIASIAAVAAVVALVLAIVTAANAKKNKATPVSTSAVQKLQSKVKTLNAQVDTLNDNVLPGSWGSQHDGTLHDTLSLALQHIESNTDNLNTFYNGEALGEMQSLTVGELVVSKTFKAPPSS